MPLVPAKCTQCGSNVEVDDSKEAAICSHCGTPFIVEKAITNYNVNIGTVNVQGANADNYAHLGDEAMTTKEYDKALDYYTKVVELIGDTRYDIHMLRLVLFNRAGKMTSEQVSGYLPEYLEHLKNDTQTPHEVKILRETKILNNVLQTFNHDGAVTILLAKYYEHFPNKVQNAFQSNCDEAIEFYAFMCADVILNPKLANIENPFIKDLKSFIDAKNIINPNSTKIIIDEVLAKTLRKEKNKMEQAIAKNKFFEEQKKKKDKNSIRIALMIIFLCLIFLIIYLHYVS